MNKKQIELSFFGQATMISAFAPEGKVNLDVWLRELERFQPPQPITTCACYHGAGGQSLRAGLAE